MSVPSNQSRAARRQIILDLIATFRPFGMTFTTLFTFAFLAVATTSVVAIDQAEERKVSNPIADDLPESEQLVFANNLQKAVADGDQEQINNLIDWNAFLEIATAGDDSPTMNHFARNSKRASSARPKKREREPLPRFLSTTRIRAALSDYCVLRNTKTNRSLFFGCWGQIKD